jgi:hypothetical protein
MFNRQLTVGVTKIPNSSALAGENAVPNPYLDPETMIPMAKDLVLDGAKLAAAMYAGARLLNTACKIAEIAAKAKF